MSSSYQLRTPTSTDADAMWRVRTAAIATIDCYPVESLSIWASTPMSPDFAKAFEEIEAVVCVDGQEILGWGFANIPVGLIAALFVDPNCHRRGIGRMIYEHFEALAKLNGVQAFSLSSSLNAVAFYEALGFVRMKDTVFQHPSGADLPSVLMRKQLD